MAAITAVVTIDDNDVESLQRELKRTKKRLSRSERLLDIAENENDVLSRQVKTLTLELRNLRLELPSVKRPKCEDASSQTDPSFADLFTQEGPSSGSVATGNNQNDVIIINDDSNQFADYKPMGFQTEEEIGLSIAESLKETASAAYGFTYDEKTGLYYDSATGVYYNEQTGLYYNPLYRAYYYYDCTKKAYEFYSYATDTEDSTHPTQSSIISTTEKGKRKQTGAAHEPKSRTGDKAASKKRPTGTGITERPGVVVCTCRRKVSSVKSSGIGRSARTTGGVMKNRRSAGSAEESSSVGEGDVIIIDEDGGKDPSNPIMPSDCLEVGKETGTSPKSDAMDNNPSGTAGETLSPGVVDGDDDDNDKMDVDVDRTDIESTSGRHLARVSDDGTKACPIHGDVEKAELKAEDKEEGELTDTDEDSDREGYIIEIESVSDESVIVVPDADDTPLADKPIRNAPCIRAIVHESSYLDIGALFIVTIAGAKIGGDVNCDIQITEPGLSEVEAVVLWDGESEHYIICSNGIDTTTLLLNSKPLTVRQDAGPDVLKHSDNITLGTTTLSVHIHDGLETCDACEPGQVVAWYAKYKKKKSPSQSSEGEGGGRTPSREERRKNETKALKKRYGLQGCKYSQNTAAVKNPKYSDKSEIRRRQIGSDNPYISDDAPSSVSTPISSGNVGRKMLMKMGWSEGKGLGRQNEGIQQPVQVMTQAGSSGLGNKTVQWTGEQINTRKSIVLEKTRKRFEQAEKKNEDRSPQKGAQWVKSTEEVINELK